MSAQTSAVGAKTTNRKVFIGSLSGTALIGLFAAPFFMLLGLQVDWAVYAAVIIGLGIIWPPITATLGTLTSEIFSTRVRYTGVTLGYQIGAAVAGGTAPLIATWLLARFDNSWVPIAGYLAALAVISIVAVALAGPVRRLESARLAELGMRYDADEQIEAAEESK